MIDASKRLRTCAVLLVLEKGCDGFVVPSMFTLDPSVDLILIGMFVRRFVRLCNSIGK